MPYWEDTCQRCAHAAISHVSAYPRRYPLACNHPGCQCTCYKEIGEQYEDCRRQDDVVSPQSRLREQAPIVI